MVTIVEKTFIFRTYMFYTDGVFHSSRYCLALNHLIIIGKYYYYINANARNKVQFGEFKSLVRDKLLLEKYIAIKSGEQDKYMKKWDFLKNI